MFELKVPFKRFRMSIVLQLVILMFIYHFFSIVITEMPFRAKKIADAKTALLFDMQAICLCVHVFCFFLPSSDVLEVKVLLFEKVPFSPRITYIIRFVNLEFMHDKCVGKIYWC